MNQNQIMAIMAEKSKSNFRYWITDFVNQKIISSIFAIIAIRKINFEIQFINPTLKSNKE